MEHTKEEMTLMLLLAWIIVLLQLQVSLYSRCEPKLAITRNRGDFEDYSCLLSEVNIFNGRGQANLRLISPKSTRRFPNGWLETSGSPTNSQNDWVDHSNKGAPEIDYKEGHPSKH